MKGKAIKKQLKDAAHAAEEASNTGAFVLVARLGFVVNGILHLLLGAIAIQLAWGTSQQADQSGAMAQLASQPGGTFLLWFGFTACATLALWQLSEAVFNYRHLEPKRQLGKRLSAAGQALVFAAISVAFSSFALGAGKNSGQATSDATAQLIRAPLGSVLVIAVGAAIAAVGIVFAVRGLRASFKSQLSLPASGAIRAATLALGTVGYAAKGIVLFLVGLLFIIATVQAHPEESTGLDGALRAVREQPFGGWLLSILGAGLICYGLFQIIKARFARM